MWLQQQQRQPWCFLLLMRAPFCGARAQLVCICHHATLFTRAPSANVLSLVCDERPVPMILLCPLPGTFL